MKVLVVQRANLEIAHMPLVKERFLVGRSPHCDVVARAPGIGPVHFLVEWIGEGAFDPKNGIWTIYDLTTVNGKGEDRLLEGIVLSEEESFEYGGLTIKIVDGGALESALDFKGSISQNLEKAKSAVAGEKQLLEMVFMRRDSNVIERISYVERRGGGKIKEHLDADYADLKFKWNNRTLALDSALPANFQMMKGAEVLKPSGGMDMISLKDEDFWTIRSPSFSVYLRYVPKVSVLKIPDQRKRDPGFWFKYWSIVLGGITLVLGVYYIIFATSEVPDPEPRIAQIEVVDYVPPPPPEEIPAPPPEVAPLPDRVPPKEVIKPKPDKPEKTKGSGGAPIKKVAEQPAAAAEPLPKKDKSKADIGLQSEAPVKNVNQSGLLGAFKSAKGESRVTADQLMNQTTSVAAADSNSGRIAIKSPPAGALGNPKPGKMVGAGGKDGFTGASTTVSGDKTFKGNSTGPIARKGSQGTGFRLGTGTEGSGSGGPGGTLGSFSAGGGIQVSGGLDKETVRRVINAYKKEIKACYDEQLTRQPNLEGRIRADWIIAANGRVQTAKSSANTTNSPALEACLLNVVRSMKFPEAPNGQPTQVIYPWQFFK